MQLAQLAGAILGTIHETELHIGRRVIAARQLRGMSRDSLAQKLNVTRDQLQQYENGQNLLSAGRLYEVARALRVNVSYFYEDLNGTTGPISCPYSLSEERFRYLKRTVQRIAADHEVTATGHRKKLSRIAAINMAREVCETLGWNYSFGRDALFAHISSIAPTVQVAHIASAAAEAVPVNCREEG